MSFLCAEKKYLPISLLPTFNQTQIDLNCQQKWQVGTVFIPDSIGYFVSTNFLAVIAHQVGGIITAVISLVVVGFACLLVYLCDKLYHSKLN